MKTQNTPNERLASLMIAARRTFGLSIFLLACSPHEAAAQATAVNLGTTENFAVLGGSGITAAGAVNSSTVTGDIGTFPTTSITGLANIALRGTNHAGDAVTQQAKNDLATAYVSAATQTPTITYGAGFDLGGSTLVSGVYNNPSAFGLTGTLTLNAAGNPNAVWIFQAGSSLVTASSSNVVLINGAQGCMVFWQVGSSATLGSNSTFVGNILSLQSITANSGASVTGRLLAQNGTVTLDTNTIALAVCAAIMSDPAVIVNAPAATINPQATNGPSTAANQAATIIALKTALIQAAQQFDTVTVSGLTSIYNLGFAQMDTEVFSYEQRLSDIRDAGAPDITAPIPSEKNPWSGGYAKNPRGGKYAKNPLLDGRHMGPVPTDEDRPWGFFITATGDYSSLGNSSTAYGYDSESLGTALGVDVQLTDHFVLGVTLGYNRNDSDLAHGGKLKSDGGRIGLYGMYHRKGFFVQGLLGGGYNSYDTERSAIAGPAKGSTDGGELDAAVTIGYDVKMGAFTVTPLASLLYTLIGINSYDERGSLAPLHIESQSESSLRARLGVRAAYSLQVKTTTITPFVSAQWQHQFLGNDLALTSRFINGSGNEFTVYGPGSGHESALVSTGVNVSWSRYAVYLAYQTELGRSNYEDQTVLVGFRVGW